MLKGSQTSLRGRATIGGAIVVKTEDPTFSAEAALEGIVEVDDFHGTSYVINGMASGGLIEDRLALRGTIEHRAGDDPRNIIGALPGQEDKLDALTAFEQTRLRGKALFLPQGDAGPWRVQGLIEYQEGTTPQTRGTVLANDVDRRDMAFTGGLRIFDTQAWVAGLEIHYAFENGARLSSITNYGDAAFVSTDDQPIIPVPQNFFFDFNETIFNQDVLFNLPDGNRASGLIGASYTLRKQEFEILNEVPPLPSGTLFANANGEQETLSAFADLAFKLMDSIDLLAGGRVLSDENDRQTFSAVLALPSPPFPISVPPAFQDFSSSETVTLPQIGVRLNLSQEQTISVTAREGWNPGGAAIQLATAQPITFESERVWTYEGAYRYVSADQRTQFSATAFYSVYDDPQFFLQLTPGSLASTIVVNLPESETYGLEIEARTSLADTLNVFVSLGILQTEVTESIATRPDLLGNRIGKDPERSATLGFDWNPLALPNLTLNGQVSYIGSFFNDFNNLPDQEIGDYTLVDFGAAYQFDQLQLRAFVNNVTDEAGGNALVTNFREVTLPRTFGLAITKRF